jgi:hypothetical protein
MTTANVRKLRAGEYLSVVVFAFTNKKGFLMLLGQIVRKPLHFLGLRSIYDMSSTRPHGVKLAGICSKTRTMLESRPGSLDSEDGTEINLALASTIPGACPLGVSQQASRIP